MKPAGIFSVLCLFLVTTVSLKAQQHAFDILVIGGKSTATGLYARYNTKNDSVSITGHPKTAYGYSPPDVNRTGKPQNWNGGVILPKMTKRKCWRKGGTWITNQTGSFCWLRNAAQ